MHTKRHEIHVNKTMTRKKLTKNYAKTIGDKIEEPKTTTRLKMTNNPTRTVEEIKRENEFMHGETIAYDEGIQHIDSGLYPISCIIPDEPNL